MKIIDDLEDSAAMEDKNPGMLSHRRERLSGINLRNADQRFQGATIIAISDQTV